MVVKGWHLSLYPLKSLSVFRVIFAVLRVVAWEAVITRPAELEKKYFFCWQLFGEKNVVRAPGMIFGDRPPSTPPGVGPRTRAMAMPATHYAHDPQHCVAYTVAYPSQCPVFLPYLRGRGVDCP